jgi:hypothetical protein
MRWATRRNSHSKDGRHKQYDPTPSINDGDHAMIELVQELISFLSQDTLSVADVVARVGSVLKEPGQQMPIELRPTLAGVWAARLSLDPDSGLPYMLTIEPEPDARPTPAMLKAALGDYRRMPTHFDLPRELMFSPLGKGTRWHVVVFVKLQDAAGSIDDAPATSIAFRRDAVDL